MVQTWGAAAGLFGLVGAAVLGARASLAANAEGGRWNPPALGGAPVVFVDVSAGGAPRAVAGSSLHAVAQAQFAAGVAFMYYALVGVFSDLSNIVDVNNNVLGLVVTIGCAAVGAVLMASTAFTLGFARSDWSREHSGSSDRFVRSILVRIASAFPEEDKKAAAPAAAPKRAAPAEAQFELSLAGQA